MITSNCKSIDKSSKTESMLRDHGIQPTSQRLAIAEVLFAKHQHVTADLLQSALNQNGILVSKATVYNTLGAFVRSGLLSEIFTDEGRTFYDTNISHHHHFYNVDTGKLTDTCEDLIPYFDLSILPEGTFLEDIDIVIRIRNKR